MNITSITAFQGPSRYSMRPVLRVRFHFPDLKSISSLPDQAALSEIFSELIPGFDKISLPGKNCTTGIDALNLIPSLALAVQNLTGCHLSFQKIYPDEDAEEQDSYETIFEYESYTVARLSIPLAFRILLTVLRRRFSVKLAEPLQAPEDYNIRNQLELFLRATSQYTLDDSSRDIIRVLEERRIPWHRIAENTRMLQAGYGNHRKLIYETITNDTSVPGSMISRDKSLTNAFLYNAGFPVPRQAVAATLDQAITHAQTLGYPLVVKPASGGQGRGITIGVQNEQELKPAFEQALKIYGQAVLEQFIAGDDHRFLVVANKVAAVAKRIPGQVVGNGKSTIRELIEILNKSPNRGKGYGRHYAEIKIDQQARDCLRKQELTLDSIPEESQAVPLRKTANMSTGGTSIDVTDQAHPDNLAMAERAAATTGLDIVGIDFLTTDISRSYMESGGGICEINLGPGLRPHWFAEGGKSRDVAATIVDHLFTDKSPLSGIPLSAAITGTNGKTTTCRMVDAILREAGLFVGMNNSDGVYIDNKTILKGDHAGFKGARTVLADSRVEAAVLETARGGILDIGTGFTACTVSAVLNITPDHLGQGGVDSLEEMAAIKQIVAELARDTIVLNADDPLCMDMIRVLGGRKLSLFTEDHDTSASVIPVANVDSVVTLTKSDQGGSDSIVLRSNDKEFFVLRTHEIPATLTGLALHNVKNAMAAIAITYSMGIELDSIQTALRKFHCDFATTPGRSNILYDKEYTIMLDHCHNPDGLQASAELVENMEAEGRNICILTSPSNRQEEHFVAMAETAAETFDHIICSNWYDLRDNPPGLVPNAFEKALKNCGFPEENITVTPDPDQAILEGLRMLQEGDFLMMSGDRGERRRKLVVNTLQVIE